MNELRRHKKSDKIKWVLTGIAFLLVAVMLTGICLQLFGTGKQKPSEWFTKPDTEQTTPDENAPAIDENGEAMNSGEVHAMAKAMTFRTAKSLAATPETQAASDYASVTLQATVLPEYAEDKAVDWSVQFAGANEWSTGKNVADYLTVTPSADGSTTATVQCLQPFGERIQIVVTSRANPMVQNACTVDFRKRILFANVGFGSTNENYYRSFNAGETIFAGEVDSVPNCAFGWWDFYTGVGSGDSWEISVFYETTVGTVGGNGYDITVDFEYSPEVIEMANRIQPNQSKTTKIALLDDLFLHNSDEVFTLERFDFGGVGMVAGSNATLVNIMGRDDLIDAIGNAFRNDTENFSFGTITIEVADGLFDTYRSSTRVTFMPWEVLSVRDITFGETSVTI